MYVNYYFPCKEYADIYSLVISLHTVSSFDQITCSCTLNIGYSYFIHIKYVHIHV